MTIDVVGKTYNQMRNPLWGFFGALVLTIFLVRAATAQAYPARAIQMIVPATPGGPVDTGARMIEPDLSAALGTPLVLVNRPGASGIVGMSSVATAVPNGYTIGAGVNSIFTIVHVSGSTVPFNIDNFLLIGNYATDVSILAVHSDAPWKNFEELIGDARNRPGKLSYASAGVGTVSSLSMQSITSAFKLDITPVPFPGGAQLTMAVMGRHVDIGMVPYSTGAEMLREGKLRPLLTTASRRLPSLPDTPTLSEKGLPTKGFNLVLGLYAPKETPQDAMAVLVEALARTMNDPSVVAKLEMVGLFAAYDNPKSARQRLEDEFKDIVELDRKLKQLQ
jgi:tripartite-type tricarboxylate transporter receptor subunit TctC